MLALWVGFVLFLLLVLAPSLYMSCIPLGVLFNNIVYQSKKKKEEEANATHSIKLVIPSEYWLCSYSLGHSVCLFFFFDMFCYLLSIILFG